MYRQNISETHYSETHYRNVGYSGRREPYTTLVPIPKIWRNPYNPYDVYYTDKVAIYKYMKHAIHTCKIQERTYYATVYELLMGPDFIAKVHAYLSSDKCKFINTSDRNLSVAIATDKILSVAIASDLVNYLIDIYVDFPKNDIDFTGLLIIYINEIMKCSKYDHLKRGYLENFNPFCNCSNNTYGCYESFCRSKEELIIAYVTDSKLGKKIVDRSGTSIVKNLALSNMPSWTKYVEECVVKINSKIIETKNQIEKISESKLTNEAKLIDLEAHADEYIEKETKEITESFDERIEKNKIQIPLDATNKINELKLDCDEKIKNNFMQISLSMQKIQQNYVESIEKATKLCENVTSNAMNIGISIPLKEEVLKSRIKVIDENYDDELQRCWSEWTHVEDRIVRIKQKAIENIEWIEKDRDAKMNNLEIDVKNAIERDVKNVHVSYKKTTDDLKNAIAHENETCVALQNKLLMLEQSLAIRVV